MGSVSVEVIGEVADISVTSFRDDSDPKHLVHTITLDMFSSQDDSPSTVSLSTGETIRLIKVLLDAMNHGSTIKRIDIAEFRAVGYLHEVNRLVLHPAGLAMEVMDDEAGTEVLGGVWDYRDDLEGMCMGEQLLSPAKAQAVADEVGRHAEERRRLFGDVIQPLPTEETPT